MQWINESVLFSPVEWKQTGERHCICARSIVFKPQLLQTRKYLQWGEWFEKLNWSGRGSLQHCRFPGISKARWHFLSVVGSSALSRKEMRMPQEDSTWRKNYCFVVSSNVPTGKGEWATEPTIMTRNGKALLSLCPIWGKHWSDLLGRMVLASPSHSSEAVAAAAGCLDAEEALLRRRTFEQNARFAIDPVALPPYSLGVLVCSRSM